jgi:hypothetical protein
MMFVRMLLAVVMVVTLLEATPFVSSEGVAAGISAEAAPCCKGDCPEDPPCETSCAMFSRCGVSTGVISPAPEDHRSPTFSVAGQFMSEPTLPPGTPPDGLERPPRI